MILIATEKQVEALRTLLIYGERKLSAEQIVDLVADWFPVLSKLLESSTVESSGAELIARKRAGHAAKGWTADHDDQRHGDGMLREVAADLINGYRDAWGLLDTATDEIDRLATAGSLIAAEIDRLQRAKARATTDFKGDK